MKNKEEVVVPSFLKKYPAKDGWFQVKNIHYSPVILYVKKFSVTRIQLRWWNGRDKGGGNGLMIGRF